MMGYTHLIVGAEGALAMALVSGDDSPELYMIATVAGAIGGTIVDIDTRDQRGKVKVTDAGRTRLAAIGLLGIGCILDFVFRYGLLSDIIARQSYALAGFAGFLIITLVGYFSKHRTISHSLLFCIITTTCVYLIIPDAAMYFMIGCLLHLVLDALNHKFQGHGIWLFYPIRFGDGIALGLCKAGRKANKVFYFIGLILFLIISALYLVLIGSVEQSVVPFVIIIYMVLAMHFVRVKSEREQRHIMHIRGEI